MERMTKKARFIEKLPSLSDAEKEAAVSFFTRYAVYESCIDWNNKSLTYRDFEKVFIKADASGKNIKRKAKNNPEVLFKKYNCRIVHKTEFLLVVKPLDWECAIFMNSFKCGGEGARWCIGDKESFETWDHYIESGYIFFLVFFSEIHPVWGKKILLSYSKRNGKFTTWLQRDKNIDGITPLFEKICRNDLFQSGII